MSSQTLDGALLRELVESCDWRGALNLPKLLFSYISSVLDAREPSIYLIDLVPSLSATAHAFLTGIGAFNKMPLPEHEVAHRRGRLLECLDAFIDEARLSQQSSVFLDALRTAERN